jgi:hypothetical protein
LDSVDLSILRRSDPRIEDPAGCVPVVCTFDAAPLREPWLTFVSVEAGGARGTSRKRR